MLVGEYWSNILKNLRFSKKIKKNKTVLKNSPTFGRARLKKSIKNIS